MIPDQIILFIVMLVLSYIFGDKIVPQLAVVFLAVLEILSIVTGQSLTNTTDAYYVFLFIINIFYTIGKTLTKEEDETKGYLEK